MGLASALCLVTGTLAVPNPTPVQLPGAVVHADPMEETIDELLCLWLNLIGLDCELPPPDDDGDGTGTGEGE